MRYLVSTLKALFITDSAMPARFLLVFFYVIALSYGLLLHVSARNLEDIIATGKDASLARERRSESSCSDGPLADKVVVHNSRLRGDNNFNLAVTWIGSDSSTLLLLTTLEIRFIFSIRAPSKLYISKDFGQKFNLAENKVRNADIRKDFGIMKSPLNPNKLILVSYSAQSIIRRGSPTMLYITTDGAVSWKKVILPFQVKDREPIQAHPKQEDWLVTLENGLMGRGASWVSSDFGHTWSKMKLFSQMVKWGAYEDKEQQTIFITTSHGSTSKPSESTLWRSRDLGKTFEKLVEHVYSFGVQAGFLFVSVQLKNQDSFRIMHVSTNGGDHFEETDVPSIKPGQFYSIVEMVNGMVFLHVDEEGNTGQGTLYTSDADGIVYTESLRNHFYTNTGITNFYRVESMRGVYMTHKLNTGNTLSSYITFDNGARWQLLYLTPGQCKEEHVKEGTACTLHFHGFFSQVRGVQVQPPLSHPNVFGLILMHASASDALTNKTNVYLTRNGGYNWFKIFDGPHHYAIGDHGNIIVVIPRLNATASTLHFSFDFGVCWHSMKFSNKPIAVRGIVTEPGAKSYRFSIWGLDTISASSHEWVVVTVNFRKAFDRACHGDDYIHWDPHAEGKKDGCLLGIKEKYPRRSPQMHCFSGPDYIPKVESTQCACTIDDFECDYGYFYKEKKCIRKDVVSNVICLHNERDKISDWHGFRRIPGDTCVGKDHTQKLIDAHQRCHLSGDATYGLVEPPKKQTSKKIALILVVLLFVGAIIAMAIVLLHRRFRKSSHRPSYKYSELVSQENDSYVAVDGQNGKVLTYHDDSESDAEMLNL